MNVVYPKRAARVADISPQVRDNRADISVVNSEHVVGEKSKKAADYSSGEKLPLVSVLGQGLAKIFGSGWGGSAGSAGSAGLAGSKGEYNTPTFEGKLKKSGMTKDKNALDFNWDGKSVGDHLDLAKNTINGKGKYDFHHEGEGGKKADTDATERLLKREGATGEYLDDRAAAGVFAALKSGGPDGRGLDVSDVEHQISRIGKKYGKDSPELNAYLEKVGALPASAKTLLARSNAVSENSDPAKKFNGISGLSNTSLDLSLFTEYTITGINKDTGKKEIHKVSKDDIADQPFIPGRLPGVNGLSFSHLSSVEIQGRVNDTGSSTKEVKVNIKDINAIAESKKDWADFEKKNVFQRIVSGVTKAVKSLVNGVKSFAKGIAGLVKGVVVGVVDVAKGIGNGIDKMLKGDMKGALGSFYDGLSNGVKAVSGGVSNAAKHWVDGVVNVATSGLALASTVIAGENVGNKIIDAGKSAVRFFATAVTGVVTSVTDSAVAASGAIANLANGRGNVFENVKTAVMGAADIVSTLGTGGAGAAVRNFGKSVFKVAKGGLHSGRLAITASSVDAAAAAKKASLVGKNKESVISPRPLENSASRPTPRSGAQVKLVSEASPQPAAKTRGEVMKEFKENFETVAEYSEAGEESYLAETERLEASG